MVGGDWNEEAGTIWELAAAGHRKLLLPRMEGGPPVSTCAVGVRRIDFFVMAEAMAGRAALEEVLEDPTLYPHKPARLEVAVGGRPADVPGLDTPAAFLSPDGRQCLDQPSGAVERGLGGV